ncbi:hypothetical protein DENIS_0528 [Desulfonema ishimotonii]|uniref:Anti-sigma factor n=2 Tax=Desulfonema ishimotonii TaxID=45657 RepID=A0A401FRJ8_9BACT|nr:hypothetical protein DENIS_0528 [Desulfonema ishimotonii]
MPTCKEITQTVSESMDRKISLRRRTGMWIHLLMCRYCFRFRKQMLMLRRISRLEDEIHADGGSSPPALSSEARARMKLALQRRVAEPD